MNYGMSKVVPKQMNLDSDYCIWSSLPTIETMIDID